MVPLLMIAMQLLAKKQQDQKAKHELQGQIYRERAGMSGQRFYQPDESKDPNAGLLGAVGQLSGKDKSIPEATQKTAAQSAGTLGAGSVGGSAAAPLGGGFSAGVAGGAGSVLQDAMRNVQSGGGGAGGGPLSSLGAGTGGDDDDLKNKLGQFGMSNLFG